MHKYTLLLCLSFLCFHAFAQDRPKVSLSASFTATNCYKSRVIQCSNGNTFLFNFNKIGCDFLLFGPDHKMIRQAAITGRLASAGKSNNNYVSNIFETDTTLAIFLYQSIADDQTLFRILIGTTTGKTVSEETVGELAKPRAGSLWARGFGVSSGFTVQNDPASGNYAIARFDGFMEADTQLHVDLYNAKNDLLWGRVYNRHTPAQKYLEFMDMIVGPDNVIVCTHEFTTHAYGTEQSTIVLSKLAAKGLIRQQQLDLEQSLKGFSVNLLYVPTAKRIMVCLAILDGWFKGGDERYKTNIAAVAEDDFSLIYNKALNLEKLDAYSRSNCKRRKDFGGSFANWMPDEQGNPILLLTEFMPTSAQSGHLITHVMQIGDIGIVRLDKDGNQTGSYVLAHKEVNGDLKPRLMNRTTELEANFLYYREPLYEDLTCPEFGGCDYIHTPDHDYFIYNIDRNDFKESICDGIVGNLGNRSPAALYTVTSGKQQRDYLFGDPGPDDLFRSAVMHSSDYSVKTKTYAVVMTEQHKRDMVSHMAWVQF